MTATARQDVTASKQRYSNFEALRIVCMLFIIAGHMIMWHKFQSDGMARALRCGVRPLFMVAVNCFVLISGWFGIKFSFKKIFSLNNSLTFWCLTLCGVALAIGTHHLSLREDFMMLIPLLAKKYWFITVYVVLCFLAPYVNILASAMTKEQFRRLLIVCVGIFVLLPTVAAVLNFPSITEDSGYGIINFLVLYLLGRYCRMHAVPHRPAWVYFAAYVALMAVCGAFQIAYSYALHFEFTTLISYDTFFVFFGAVALFCAFSRLKFASPVINTLATACFAVYILHIHPWIKGWTFEYLLGMENASDTLFLIYLIIVPVGTYLACFALEQCRHLIFKATSSIVRLCKTKRN